MGPVWYSRYGVYIEEIKYGYVSKIMFCPRLVSMRVVPSLTGYKCKTRKQKSSTSPISPWGGKIQNNQILSHNAYFLEAVECCCVSQLLHCVKMHLPPTSPPTPIHIFSSKHLHSKLDMLRKRTWFSASAFLDCSPGSMTIYRLLEQREKEHSLIF